MRHQSAGAHHPFASSRRRAVARACAFGARTSTEIARQLATDRGAVTTVIRQLVSEGVLRVTSVAHATGRAYELVHDWRPALVEATGSAAPRGQIEPGARLLIVGGRDAAAVAGVIAAVAADPVVVWAARLDGPPQARLLITARGETPADRDQVDRLETVLAAAGLDCVQLRVDRVLELTELERYARTLTRRPPAPELPRASSSDT
jgi:hypothetical protein